MMNPSRHLVLILPLLLSACVTKPIPFGKEATLRGFEANRQYLVGKWRGESPLEGGGRRISLIHRFDDGTYLITFVAVREGQPITVQSEYGDWGLSGDVYFTMTRGHGAELPEVFVRRQRTSYVDDAYRIAKLTPEEFQYASVSTGRSYTTRKMPDDYVMPEVPKVAAMPGEGAHDSSADSLAGPDFPATGRANESLPELRTGKVLGKVTVSGGGVYEVTSAVDFDWPNLEQAGKILTALVAAKPNLALVARTFSPVAVQIVPLWRDCPEGGFLVRQSIAVGDFQVWLVVSASAKPDLSSVTLNSYPPTVAFWGCYIPPDTKSKSRLKLDDLGPGTAMEFDQIAEFCRAPEAYLRGHVPTNERGQKPLLGGVSIQPSFGVRVRYDSPNGTCPLGEQISMPVYPAELRRAGVSGEVSFEAIVQPDGHVTDFREIKATVPGFSSAVRAAVLTWTFRPSSSGFGPRSEIIELFDRRAEAQRPQLIRGTIGFSPIDE